LKVAPTSAKQRGTKCMW